MEKDECVKKKSGRETVKDKGGGGLQILTVSAFPRCVSSMRGTQKFVLLEMNRNVPEIKT